MALLMSTATGFRSEAWASSPSRCASREWPLHRQKRIVEGRQFLRIEKLDRPRVVSIQFAHLPPRAANFCTRAFQNDFVRSVLPQHEVLNDLEQPLPLDCSFLLVFSILEPTALLVTGVIDELSKENRPRGC